MRLGNKVLALNLAFISLTMPVATAFAQQVSVPISFHRQEHSLSCEIASLKTALKTHGIDVSENELIARLPFDPTPRGGGVWGNPNRGFVGDIDGSMLGTGYGVYWDPIAELGASYAHTEVIRHGSPQQLASHVAVGNPVIIWGYYGERALYTWQSPDGIPIKAIDGEHTMVVYGFDGTVDAPTRFYLMDPLRGQFSWSTQELMFNWSGLNHMGVVVAKHPRWVRVPGETQVWELSRDGTTRRWVTTWDTFVRRGGSAEAVADISAEVLQEYELGPPIE